MEDIERSNKVAKVDESFVLDIEKIKDLQIRGSHVFLFTVLIVKSKYGKEDDYPVCK